MIARLQICPSPAEWAEIDGASKLFSVKMHATLPLHPNRLFWPPALERRLGKAGEVGGNDRLGATQWMRRIGCEDFRSRLLSR